MKFASLNDLYFQQLKDLHSAESQLIKALPTLAKAASNPELRNALIEHLAQTKGHLERLKQVAEKLGKRLAGHPCAAMKGLLEEGREWLEAEAETEVRDAGIIAGAQRVEHYEMAGYGTVQTFAKLLGETEAAELFTLTLNEEKAADKKLTLLAKSINVKAKAAKPLASVKTAVKRSAKPPAKSPSSGQREVRSVGSTLEAEPTQPE
jgi:ferritin-like metal-binding protein YciE